MCACKICISDMGSDRCKNSWKALVELRATKEAPRESFPPSSYLAFSFLFPSSPSSFLVLRRAMHSSLQVENGGTNFLQENAWLLGNGYIRGAATPLCARDISYFTLIPAKFTTAWIKGATNSSPSSSCPPLLLLFPRSSSACPVLRITLKILNS